MGLPGLLSFRLLFPKLAVLDWGIGLHLRCPSPSPLLLSLFGLVGIVSPFVPLFGLVGRMGRTGSMAIRALIGHRHGEMIEMMTY